MKDASVDSSNVNQNTSERAITSVPGSLRHFLRSPYNQAMMLISIIFVIWAFIFIYQSTFVIEGQRYFSLFDDGMVSMRYGLHLAQGRGLTWNEGLPIEGFTNFLMMLIMAASTAVFGPYTAILVIQICGIFWMLMSAGLTYAIASIVLSDRDDSRRKWSAVCVFAMTLTYYPIAYWSLMGMETGLLSVLTLAALYLAIKPQVNRYSGLILPVLIGLCFWTRSDALVLALPIWVYHLWTLSRKKSVFFQEGAIIGGFIVSLSLFRLWYFGSVVPNTYILKIEVVPLASRIANGLGFIEPFILGLLSPFIYICVSLVRRRSGLVIFCLMLAFFSLMYQVWAGGDVWPYWRMMVPVMPLFFVLIMWSFQLRWLVTLPAVIAFMVIMNGNFLAEITYSQPIYQTELNRTLVATALALNDITNSEAKIAVFHAGIIPYYNDALQVIDCLGKTDAYIARLAPDVSGAVSWHGMTSVPGHNKYDLEYCIGMLQPDYTEYMVWGRDDLRGGHPEYQLFEYKGVELWLNTQSNNIRWDLVSPIASR